MRQPPGGLPLQLSYIHDHVANSFNRRPHLLVSRFLEVAGAFSSVAFQVLTDGQKVSKDKSGLVNEEAQSSLHSQERCTVEDFLSVSFLSEVRKD